jgi:hypothetical protein
MPPRRFFLPIFVVAVLLLASCAGGPPVRNLASDAAMIKAGQTSRQELTQLLGEPDQRQPGAKGQEIWIYHEKEKSRIKTAPVVGRLFTPRREETLTVVIRDNVVFSSQYGAFAYDQQSWNNDFDWQKGKK